VKTLLYSFLTIILAFFLIYFSSNIKENQLLATSSNNSTSDVQLIARAINRRSKRRNIRRTSSCWSSYFEQSEKQ
jgi:hypothetical protein